MTNRYVMFDRDGTWIEHVPYLFNWSEARLQLGAFEVFWAWRTIVRNY